MPGRDFVKMNRTAVTAGAVSSKDIAAFRTTHDARQGKAHGSPSATRGAGAAIVSSVPDPNATFGRPSKPSTPIHDVLTNSFQRAAIVEARRVAEEAEARRLAAEGSKAGKFGASQHTRASLGHMKIAAPLAKEPFKLAKFQAVAPRIGHQGFNTLAANKDNQARQMASMHSNQGGQQTQQQSSSQRLQQQQQPEQEEKEQSSPAFYEQQQQQSASDSRRFDDSSSASQRFSSSRQ